MSGEICDFLALPHLLLSRVHRTIQDHLWILIMAILPILSTLDRQSEGAAKSIFVDLGNRQFPSNMWKAQNSQLGLLYDKGPWVDKSQEGRLLEVCIIGPFPVEWHLATGMKTVKCTYGLKMGANSLHSCIYCDQEQVKPVVGTTAQAATAINSRKCTWTRGLFSLSVSAKLLMGAYTHSRWKPIIQSPYLHITRYEQDHWENNRLVFYAYLDNHRFIFANASHHRNGEDSVTDWGSSRQLCHFLKMMISLARTTNKPSFSRAYAMKLFAKHPSDIAKIEGH